MIAVLVRTPHHISAWFLDNRAEIKIANRVKNQFTMNDGTIVRLFVVRGSVDIERLRGYDWQKIIIQYGKDNVPWQANVQTYVCQLPIDPSRVEFKE